MKVVFLSVLFGLFLWNFAIPSFHKYLYSGLMVDTTWKARTPEDSPSLTFCAMNSLSYVGWKKKMTPVKNMTAIDLHCNQSKTTIEALNCFEENTYNLTDTIKSKESYFSNAVKPNDKIWQEEIFETYLGNKSFSWLQLNHCANYCVNF